MKYYQLFLLIFFLFMLIIYFTTIILYSLRNKTYNYNNSYNSIKERISDRGSITLFTVLLLGGLLALLITLEIKISVPVIVIILLTNAYVTLSIGIIISTLSNKRFGIVLINIGGLSFSLISLIYLLIRISWYFAILAFLLMIVILLSITYLISKRNGKDASKYVRVILAISLAIVIIVSMVELSKLGMWYFIIIGIVAIISEVSLIAKPSH